MVRRDAGGVSLESFARCPQCGRNDRVEKVSAIIRSQSQEIGTSVKHTEVYFDQYGNQQTRIKEVPTKQTQVSSLVQSLLLLPEKPDPLPLPNSIPKPTLEPEPKFQNPKFLRILLFIIAALLLITSFLFTVFAIVSLINDQNVENLLSSGLPPFILFVFGIIALVIGILIKPISEEDFKKWESYKEQKLLDWRKSNKEKTKRWQEDNDQLIQNWKSTNSHVQEIWIQGMEDWNNLYFCHRDDCVFIPGKDRYAPVDKMKQFLFKGLPKPAVKSVVEPQQQYKPSQNTQIHQRTTQSINRCPNCKSTNVTKPHRQNISCVWLIFIFFSMGLGLIFWFFTPEYITCNNCKAKWKV
jgi:hypothetical protein